MLSIPVVGGGVGAAVVVVGFGFCDTSPKKIFLKTLFRLVIEFLFIASNHNFIRVVHLGRTSEDRGWHWICHALMCPDPKSIFVFIFIIEK